MNSRIKRKYGAFVRSRRWWKQFRELVVACLTHNIDKVLWTLDREDVVTKPSMFV